MSLRKLLRNEMERVGNDVKAIELANELGVDSSTFSHFFNYKQELNFCNILGAIRYLNPENEESLMAEIINLLVDEDQKMPIRHSMEYLSTSGNLDLLEQVINSQLKSTNKENRDWAEAYLLSTKYQKGTQDDTSLITEINNLKPKFLETRLFLDILKLNLFYRMGHLTVFSELAPQIEKQVLKIKSDFIRCHYLARISEILSKTHLLVFNNTKKARFYANNLLNAEYICANFKYNSYYIVGMSYFFENYEECVKYLETYVTHLEKYGKHRREERINNVVNSDIVFAKILWGEDLENFSTSDILEKAHYECRYGDKTKALEILKTFGDKENPFYLCYKGMATDNPQLIFESAVKLVAKGQKFFANIPMMQLEKFNQHGEMLKSVLNNFYIA